MGSSAVDFGGPEIEGLADAPRQIARNVWFLHYGEPLLLSLLQ